MKTIYTINYTTRVESHPMRDAFGSINEARAFFESEKEKLSANTLADTTGWEDSDQAWGDVYLLELVETTIDDDGDIEDMVEIDSTDYYYR